MKESKPAEVQPQADLKTEIHEEKVSVSDVAKMVDAAVQDALAKQRHQHTPLPAAVTPELAGRTREEGYLIVDKLNETKGYIEVGFNDGTIRRDYK